MIRLLGERTSEVLKKHLMSGDARSGLNLILATTILKDVTGTAKELIGKQKAAKLTMTRQMGLSEDAAIEIIKACLEDAAEFDDECEKSIQRVDELMAQGMSIEAAMQQELKEREEGRYGK